MIAFLTKKRDLINKYDIVYIFNNETLFNDLSKNFNCVNLERNGKIKNINFKKKFNLEDYQILEIQKAVYFYLRKRSLIKIKKDFHMKMIYEMEIKNEIGLAISYMDTVIKGLLDEIISMSIDNGFLRKYEKFIQILFNYINSFYNIYAMKFGYDERIEIFKTALFLNILNFYRFDRFDLNDNGFKRGYLKVISRLFIEQIHRKDFVW